MSAESRPFDDASPTDAPRRRSQSRLASTSFILTVGSLAVVGCSFLVPVTGWDRLGVLLCGFLAGICLFSVAGVLLLVAVFRSWKGRTRWELTAAAATVWLSVVGAAGLYWIWPTTEKMIAAAGAGDNASVSLALAYGIDINAQSHLGPTALTHAIHNHRGLTVVYLLSRGADINRVDGSGNTPLEAAAKFLDATMVEQLLASGARLRFDAQGRPMPVAEIEQLLKEYPSRPDVIDPNKAQEVLKVLNVAALKQPAKTQAVTSPSGRQGAQLPGALFRP